MLKVKEHAIIIKSLREGGKLMSKTIYRRVFFWIFQSFRDINYECVNERIRHSLTIKEMDELAASQGAFVAKTATPNPRQAMRNLGILIHH